MKEIYTEYVYIICVRLVLVQLDLQSVEKVHFSTFAWAYAPKTLEIDLPRLSMSRSFLEDPSRVYPLLHGSSSCRKSPSALLDPTGSNTNTINPRSDRKKQTDLLQPGPWRSGKQLWIDLGENSDSYILRRGRPISRQKLVHANVLKL